MATSTALTLQSKPPTYHTPKNLNLIINRLT